MTQDGPAGVAPDAREGRALSPGECREWLRGHHEGRLEYESGRGHRAVVVNYSVARDSAASLEAAGSANGRGERGSTIEAVYLQVPDFNEIAHYAPRSRVTLNVAGRAADGGRDVVRVSGVAHEADPARTEVDAVELWPADVATRLIKITLDRVAGTAEAPTRTESTR